MSNESVYWHVHDLGRTPENEIKGAMSAR